MRKFKVTFIPKKVDESEYVKVLAESFLKHEANKKTADAPTSSGQTKI